MSRPLQELYKALDTYFPSICSKIAEDSDIRAAVENGLAAIANGTLSWARLNQIMHLCSQAGMSEAFYRYYFLISPEAHPYPVEKVFSPESYTPPMGPTR